MGEVIEIKSRLQKRPPAWGALISIEPNEAGNPIASLTSFWGSDGFEVSERCDAFAEALSSLAMKLRETAIATKATP